MNAAEEKNGFGALFDLAAGLLKNPAVMEGILTGISALTASRRVKNPKTSDDGFDLGGIFEMLPQILPLLSLFKGGIGDLGGSENVMQSLGGASDEGDTDNSVDVMSDAMSDVISESDEASAVSADRSGSVDVSYGNKKEQRENLILAIRPFLSESRVAAADAMLEMNRISGIFRA